MSTIQVKNVPPDLHEAVRRLAEDEGKGRSGAFCAGEQRNNRLEQAEATEQPSVPLVFYL